MAKYNRHERRDEGGLDSHTLGIFRTAATVKGGRRFSFGAMVVVGDHKGRVGYGYAKAQDVPGAIEKANKKAKQVLTTVPLEGATIPHEVLGRFLTARVKMVPASPGTGVVAGTTVRAVLEMAGVTDCLTKCYGSTNSINVVKAVVEGLSRLQTAQRIAELRGVELEKTETAMKIEAGSRFMGSAAGGATAVAEAPAEVDKKSDPEPSAESSADPAAVGEAKGESSEGGQGSAGDGGNTP